MIVKQIFLYDLLHRFSYMFLHLHFSLCSCTNHWTRELEPSVRQTHAHSLPSWAATRLRSGRRLRRRTAHHQSVATEAEAAAQVFPRVRGHGGIFVDSVCVTHSGLGLWHFWQDFPTIAVGLIIIIII